jgi:hypothetical protein
MRLDTWLSIKGRTTAIVTLGAIRNRRTQKAPLLAGDGERGASFLRIPPQRAERREAPAVSGHSVGGFRVDCGQLPRRDTSALWQTSLTSLRRLEADIRVDARTAVQPERGGNSVASTACPRRMRKRLEAG